jgi:uncharacterized phage protein (TIGR01671 family)
MREIKFRGKSVDNGEWVYGCYCRFFGKQLVDHIEIDINTVGQFIGLEDKYGKEIYEGDIVTNGIYNMCIVHHMGAFRIKFSISKYEPYDSYTYIKDYSQYRRESKYSSRFRQNPKNYEVIGNINDNPELLTGVYYV